MNIKEAYIEDMYIGHRLDKVVSLLWNDISRSSLKSLNIEVFVNGRLEKFSYKLKKGDHLKVVIPEIKSVDLIPQEIKLEILYKDEDIAVINKPHGLPVHPSKGHTDNTLVNALLYHLKGSLSSIGGYERPGIVHRLDKDTAGLMIIALNDSSHRRLIEMFKNHKVNKIYHAIVKGITKKEDIIESPIGRSKYNRKKMAVVENGKLAITKYRVLEYLNNYSYLEVNILTGRTHQIRVHLSNEGHPVLGDSIYSRNNKKINTLCLIAKKLSFNHPINNKYLEFEVPLSNEFKEILDKIREGVIE